MAIVRLEELGHTIGITIKFIMAARSSQDEQDL
jgi:hypothetical protein